MKYAFILIAAVLFSFKKSGSEIDYRKVFGNDYKWAVNWLVQNDKTISAYADKYGIPAREIKAIIFPELVRYNRVFDAIQIESLKFLYVSEGKQYADFSVGYFQMKPSFAENLERDADKVFGYGFQADNEENRRQRLYRLTNTETQLNYLCAFYRLCEKRFSGQRFGSVSAQLKFFATAYNAGYHLSPGKLNALQLKKHFSGYNYSDISLFYFTHE